MDVDHFMLFPIEQAHHMCKNHCFICHKEGCSTRNHSGYNWSCPTGSWYNNSKPSQTAHARVISTTLHSTPIPHQDNLLDSFLKDITKAQGHDQVLYTLRSTFDLSLDKQENLLANEQPTAKEWDESARVLAIEAISHISLPDHCYDCPFFSPFSCIPMVPTRVSTSRVFDPHRLHLFPFRFFPTSSRLTALFSQNVLFRTFLCIT